MKTKRKGLSILLVLILATSAIVSGYILINFITISGTFSTDATMEFSQDGVIFVPAQSLSVTYVFDDVTGGSLISRDFYLRLNPNTSPTTVNFTTNIWDSSMTPVTDGSFALWVEYEGETVTNFTLNPSDEKLFNLKASLDLMIFADTYLVELVVEATEEIVPPTPPDPKGNLNIIKAVIDSGVENETFEVTISGTNYSNTVYFTMTNGIVTNTPILISDLDIGSYTITEVNVPIDWTESYDYSNPVEVTDGATTTITITNTYSEPPPSPEFDYYVGPSETYTTIQSAVNVASEGESIFVRNGVYDEHVYILGTNNVDYISITGESQSGVIITGGVSTETVLITATGVTISTLTVDSDKQQSMYCNGVTGFYLSDLTIKGTQSGVTVNGGSGYVIDNCDIIHIGTSLYDENGINLPLDTTIATIKNTTITDFDQGILFRPTAGTVTVEYCIINGADIGINGQGQTLTISHSTITNIITSDLHGAPSTTNYYHDMTFDAPSPVTSGTGIWSEI